MWRKISAAAAALVIALAFLFIQKGPCQVFRYDAKGKRDPFVPLVGVERVKISGLEDVISIDDVKLEGIAVGPGGKKTVIVNGRMLKESDRVGAVEIIKIGERAVTLMVSGTEYRIDLPKEGEPKNGSQN